LANYLQGEYGLSTENTFSTGMSNGGDMSYMLGCQASDVFKAIAPVAGCMMESIYDTCNPNPIPVLEIHGTNDNVTLWNGDMNNNDGWGSYLSTTDGIDYWVGANECTASETILMNNVIHHRYFDCTDNVEVFTVTVSPLTVKSPAIVTSSGKPIVTVPELSPTSTSLEVPANVIVPPSATAVLLEPSATVIEELASLALAIDPANSALATPPSLIVTAPLDTAKLSELNEATPLFEVVASSPAIVIVFPVAEVSIPSPPAIVRVSESKSIAMVPLSVVASKS